MEADVTTFIRCVALALFLAVGLTPAARAQDQAAPAADDAAKGEEMHGRLEGMNEQVQTLVADVDKLKKFKFSGYIQARWETAENKNDSVRVTGTPPVVTAANLERFYRVDKARSREKGGTGLGLAIVRHILALHGGRVTVESALGQGSTFRFELPPAPAVPAAGA